MVRYPVMEINVYLATYVSGEFHRVLERIRAIDPRLLLADGRHHHGADKFHLVQPEQN